MNTKATFQGGKLTLACVSTRADAAEFSVTLDVTDVLDGMHAEDRRALVDAVLMSEDILAGALRRLAGDTDCWRGDDVENREAWLISIGAVHETAVKNANEARERAQTAEREIRWKAHEVSREVFDHVRDIEALRPCCRGAIGALAQLWDGPDAGIEVPSHVEAKAEVAP